MLECPIRDVNQLVREGIARLRLKLLDLTNRNRLLNFKFPESSRKFVRVIDALPDALYERLTDDSPRNGKLYFTALPQPPPDLYSQADTTPNTALATEVRDDIAKRDPPGRSYRPRHSAAPRVDHAEWARQNGIDPSFDLPLKSAAVRDGQIQTLLLPDAMDSKLSAIREDARLANQELGLNTLFAAFGFLEWYESVGSQQALYSPLLLVPVQMDRDLRSGQYRYFIEPGDSA